MARNGYLNYQQRTRMMGKPEPIRQYAHFLGTEFERHGFGKVAIHVEARASLDEGPGQLMIDPAIDLEAERPTLSSAP